MKRNKQMSEKEQATLDKYAEWANFRAKDGSLLSDPMDQMTLLMWIHYNAPEMEDQIDRLWDLLYANYELQTI